MINELLDFMDLKFTKIEKTTLMLNYNFSGELRCIYMHLMHGKTDASQCFGCGQCENKCLQRLKIIARLKKAHETLRGWEEK